MLDYLTTIVLLLALVPLLGSVTQCVAFRIINVNVSKFTLFYGGPIVRVPLAGTQVHIGYIPTGSSIEYDIPVFSSKPMLIRLMLILLGPASLILFASFALGFDQALSHFVSGFIQLTKGAYSPLATAPDYITKLHNIFLVSRLDVSGIVAAKMASYSCLPIGGMTVAEIIRQLSGRYSTSEPITRFVTFSAVVAILLAALWAVALVTYSINNIT